MRFYHCFCIVTCFSVISVFAQDISWRSAHLNSSELPGGGLGGTIRQRIVFVNGSTSFKTVYFRYDGAGADTIFNLAVGASRETTLQIVQYGQWEGMTLPSGDSPEVPLSFSFVGKAFTWGVTSDRPNAGVLNGGHPSGVVSYLDGAFNVPSTIVDPVVVTLTDDGFLVDDPYEEDPEPSETRGELMLMLYNDTGVPQDVLWGDKMLHLAPGMNQLRYDGAIQDGMPQVAPEDIWGVAYEQDGTQYFQAHLGFHPSGEGVQWLEPPQPPNMPPPGPDPAKDVIEILNSGTDSQGPTIAIRHPNGATTITTLPKTPPPTASNTSGSGSAVLSNPTQPKPEQTTTNTTNNITNNITNNTITNSTTVILDDGTNPTDQPSNVGEIDAIEFEPGVGTPDVGLPDDLSADKVKLPANKFVEKFSSFSPLVQDAIPRAQSYPLAFDLGRFGAFNDNVDLTATPIPQVRFAILVITTLSLGVAFIQKITI